MADYDTPAHITVTRNAPEDAQQRQVILKLDGKKVATLMFGQSKTMEVEPGKHTLVADNTWKKKSLGFEIRPGEHLRFKTVNTLSTFGWMLAVSLGAGPMKIELEREPAEQRSTA